MISELKEIIHKIEQLNDNELRILTKLLNEELQWIKALSVSPDKLSLLAIEAIGECRSA
jgi:hypothetical protein